MMQNNNHRDSTTRSSRRRPSSSSPLSAGPTLDSAPTTSREPPQTDSCSLPCFIAAASHGSSRSSGQPRRRWRRRKSASSSHALHWPTTTPTATRARQLPLFESAMISGVLFILVILFSLTHSSQQHLLAPKPFRVSANGGAISGGQRQQFSLGNSPLTQTKFASSRHFYPRPPDFSGGGGGNNNLGSVAARSGGSETLKASDHLNAYRYELSEPKEDTAITTATRTTTERWQQQPQQLDGSNKTDHRGAADKLAEIQKQVASLKRQLELELELSERQAALGSPCLTSKHCAKSIVGSHCNLETQACACLPQHLELNSTTCLPPSLLGYECLIDAQCQQRVANSYCANGVCACPTKFVAFRKDKCLPASKVNDYCLSDRQCRLADRHSHCKWRIPHVYGICKCPPNYKPITVNSGPRAPSSGAGSDANQTLGPAPPPTTTAVTTNTTLRCAPRLGDSCFDHEDCLLATRNAVCREPRSSDSLHTSWPTSEASPLKCFCAQGFREASNRLDCRPTPTTTSAAAATTIAPAKAPAAALVAPGQAPRPPGDALGNVGASRSTTRWPLVFIGAGGFSQLLPAPTASAHFTLSVGNAMDAKHHYELVIANQSHVLLSAPPESREATKTSTATTTTTTTTTSPPARQQQIVAATWASVAAGGSTSRDGPKQSSKAPATPTTTAAAEKQQPASAHTARPANGAHNSSTTTANDLRVSSLGKPCSSSRDCQARDQHSHCVMGICECLAPTSRCSSNSTGCHKDTFQCRNGQCISWYFVCDQFQNCDDGSDEENCSSDYISAPDHQYGAHIGAGENNNSSARRRCPPETFECGDNSPSGGGACLSLGKLCDGKRDCPNGADELRCSWRPPAAATPLGDSSSPSALGEGVGGSPEKKHEQQQQQQAQLAPSASKASHISSAGCHPKAFACSNGQCLPAYVFCNAVEDCADGSDEDEQLCERAPLWASAASPSSSAASLPPSAQLSPQQQPGRKWQPIPAGGEGDDAADPPTGSLSVPPSSETQHSGDDDGGGLISESPPCKSGGSSRTEAAAAAPPAAPLPAAKANTPTDSPLVKTDRTAIERMLAALAGLVARTPEKRGRRRLSRQRQQQEADPQWPPGEHAERGRDGPAMRPQRLKRRPAAPSEQQIEQAARAAWSRPRGGQMAARRRQSRLVVSSSHQLECPKSTFVCANGKCRSSAILCSGVDGCGDNSDEDRCEVCQCEAPALKQQETAGPSGR